MPNPDNLKKRKSFTKDDPRINRKGRPKTLPDLQVLLAEILGEEKDGKTAAQAILAALRAKAAKGDVRAAEVLMDRAWGKAKQSIEHSGSIDSAIQIIQLPDNGRDNTTGEQKP